MILPIIHTYFIFSCDTIVQSIPLERWVKVDIKKKIITQLVESNFAVSCIFLCSQHVKLENNDVAKHFWYKQETTLNIIFSIPRYHIKVSPNWNLAFQVCYMYLKNIPIYGVI